MTNVEAERDDMIFGLSIALSQTRVRAIEAEWIAEAAMRTGLTECERLRRELADARACIATMEERLEQADAHQRELFEFAARAFRQQSRTWFRKTGGADDR